MKKIVILLLLAITPHFISAQWSMVRFDEYNFFTKAATPDPATSIVAGLEQTGMGCFIMRTNDGGMNWDSIPINATASYSLADMNFTDVNNGFASGTKNNTNQVLIKTSDNGTTWNEITPDPTQADPLTAVYFVNPLTGFASDETRLYKTIDGGINWTTYTPGFIIEDVNFADATNGYACGESTPDAVVMKTTDGGATWNPVLSTMIPFFTVSRMQTLDVISQDVVFVSSQYSNILYKTTDGGSTWDTLTMAQIYGIQDYDFVSATEGHVLSTMGEIYGTFDGGLTWTLEYAVAGGAYGPSVFLTSVSFAGSTGYVCGSNGLIKKYTDPVGIDELSVQGINFYPNPVRSGQLLFQTGIEGEFTLRIYSLTGQCVLNSEFQSGQPVPINLTPGNYLAEIVSGNTILHNKFVVID